MLRDGTDGRTVLDYFKKRANAIGSVDHYYGLAEAELDFEAAILSETHKDIEKEARQLALKQYLRKGKKVKAVAKGEDEPEVEEEVESKGFLGNKKPAAKAAKAKKEYVDSWESSLREVEENQMGASYQYFFMGRKEPVFDEASNTVYSHPRQILEDLNNESLNDNEVATLVWERLGFQEPAESGDVDSDAEDQMLKRIDEIAEEKVIKKYHEDILPYSKNQLSQYAAKDMMEIVN